MTSLKFKHGDEVVLTRLARSKYGIGPNQGGGGRGTVIFAGHRESDATRPYLVRWDSDPGGFNSYREEDLAPAGFRFGVVEEGR